MVSHSPQKNLVDQLCERLKGPLAIDEPFVLKDRIPQTRSLHVLVIWDKWRKLDREERSAIIMDAFVHADALKNDTIRVALGLTQREALDMGYLPFKIESMHRKGDRALLNKLRKALESVGGIHTKTGASHQVRFPSQELAEEAYRQLSTEVPGPYWAIVQEVATD